MTRISLAANHLAHTIGVDAFVTRDNEASLCMLLRLKLEELIALLSVCLVKPNPNPSPFSPSHTKTSHFLIELFQLCNVRSYSKAQQISKGITNADQHTYTTYFTFLA